MTKRKKSAATQKTTEPKNSTETEKATEPLPALQPLDSAQRYTIEEAMRYLRTSHQTLYNLINSGEIATIKEGGRRYIPGSEIVRRSAVPMPTPSPPPTSRASRSG